MADLKQLRIDMDEVFGAMNISPDMRLRFFLDLDTGEVRLVSDDRMSDEEDAVEEEREATPERFEEIPSFEGREKYDLMRRFAESVEEDDIRDMLALALRGRGAFSRFRDVVNAYPDLTAAWRAMERAAMLRAAEEWLASLGIEPVHEPRWAPEVPAVSQVKTIAPAPGPRPAREPRIDLLDVLLLGAPEGKTELLNGRVLRAVQVRTASEARVLFKGLARDLCDYFGLAWRNRFIKGKSGFDIERAHLRVEGTSVELWIDVPVEVWKAF